MDVISAPIVFILMVSTTAVQPQILKGPVNALKNVDDSVTLECVTNSKDCDEVEWKKMEGAQSPKTVYRDGIILNGFPRERYSVNSSGGCSLTITQLNISDSGRFSCVITVDGSEKTRSSILVVINVTEACRSDVTSNALNQNDSYSVWTVINVPAKSVEPSNVVLSFQKEAADETESTDESHSQTVTTTLTGIAIKENITQRVCRASLPPTTAAGFDSSTATLYVCTTQQLIVSYPVGKIAVSYHEDGITKERSPSPTGSYNNGATVRCTAEGYPNPTFKWTHLKSGKVVADGNTLVINGEAGDEYTCTATNTVKGKTTYLNKTIRVTVVPPPEPDPGCGPSCKLIVGCVVAVIVFKVVTLLVCFCVPGCPLFKLRNSSTDKKNDKRTNGNEEDPEKSRINMNCSNTPQCKPLNVLVSHDSEELTTPSKVDAVGQSLHNGATNEELTTPSKVDAVGQSLHNGATNEELTTPSKVDAVGQSLSNGATNEELTTPSKVDAVGQSLPNGATNEELTTPSKVDAVGQSLHNGATNEELTTPSKVDVVGQSLSNGATNENMRE